MTNIAATRSRHVRPSSMTGNRYQDPRTESVEVFPDRIVLATNRTPFSPNQHLPAVLPRWQGPSRYSETADWRDWAIRLGLQGRIKGRWPLPVRGEVRHVHIALWRARLMDLGDNRNFSLKPIIDGLTLFWKLARPIKGGPVVPSPGAGLIYDDDGEHLPEGALEVVQDHCSWKEERLQVTVFRCAP